MLNNMKFCLTAMICILLSLTRSYAQSDTSKVGSGRFWSVQAGFNLLVPTHGYKEELIPIGFDDARGEFDVSPKMTADNFFLNVNYDLPIYRRKRSRIGLAFGAGWLHQRRKVVKEGWYGDGFTSFQGIITITRIEDFLTLTIRPDYRYRVSRNVEVYGAIDVSLYNFLFQFDNLKMEGNISRNGFGGTWFPGGLYLNTKLETGVSVRLTRRLKFNSSVSISLVYANWDKEYFRPTPTSVTPYPASITEFNYLSINNSLIIVISKLKK